MKKILFLGLALMLCSGLLKAQDVPYYGTPFYKQGFDSTTIEKTGWSQIGDTNGTAVNNLWKTGNISFAAQVFSKADPTSTYSAWIKFTANKNTKTRLLSPSLSVNGNSNICVGFSIHNTAITTGGVTASCAVSKDGGTTWDTIWFSNKTSTLDQQATLTPGFTGYNWTTYQIFLPSSYDGQTIQAQFILTATNSTSDFYLDGFFLSSRMAYDAQLIDYTIKSLKIDAVNGLINLSNNVNVPYNNGFMKEPLTFTFKNKGTTPIDSITVAYLLQGSSPVSQTFHLSSSLTTGNSTTLTFDTPLNIDTPKQSKTLRIYLDMYNEQNRYNDTSRSITLYNTNAALPYIANFTSLDDWQVDLYKKSDKFYPWSYTTSDIVPALSFSQPSVSTVPTAEAGATHSFTLQAGKSYDIKFSLFTNAKNNIDSNAANIYIAPSIDTALYTPAYLQFSAVDIKNDNRYKNVFIRFTATKDTVYYVTIVGKCKNGASGLLFEDFTLTEVKEKDIQILDVSNPATPKYTYTNAEQVAVRVHNSGSSAISQYTIYSQLDTNTIRTQNVTGSINAGQTVSITLDGTYDLSGYNNKLLKTWVKMDGDSISFNDSIATSMLPILTTIPYTSVDFANKAVLKLPYIADYWTVVDSNEDGKVWNLNSGTNPPYFYYSGASGGTSNDLLFSRPLHLNTNQIITISFQAKTSNASGRIPLSVNLYTKTDNKFTLVQSLYQTLVSGTAVNTYYANATVSTAGDYYVSFETHDQNVLNTYSIYVQNINITPAFDNDLTVSEVLFPGNNITGLDSLPVGLRVKNIGLSPVQDFTIGCRANKSSSIYTQFITDTIQPYQEKVYYFANQPTFKGTINIADSLKAWVSLPADQARYNDSSLFLISNATVSTLPYTVSQVDNYNYLLSIDGNQDGNRWTYSPPGGSFSTFGFGYKGNAEPANDYLLTRQFTLNSTKKMRLDFNASIGSTTKPANIEVLIGKSNHVETMTQIASFPAINATNSGVNHTVYFTVPSNGNYAIAFHLTGDAQNILINNIKVVDTVKRMPNVKVEMVYPTANAIYSANDSVVVKISNIDSAYVSGIPLTFQVNDLTYNVVAYSLQNNLNIGESFTYTLRNVDLFNPGTYNITAFSSLASDSDRNNDTAKVSINSLPIPDASVTGLISPVSGTPIAAADVMVKVKNIGKGDISNFPISYTIDGGTPVTETITDTLSTNEEITYTFTTQANLSAEKLYAIAVYTSLSADVNTSNDTLRQNLRISTKGFDVAMSAILNPVDGKLTIAETVKVKVINNSPFSITNIPVYCKLNDNVLSGVVPMVDSLGSTEYTFTGSFNMAHFGNYTLTAYTALSNDADRSNDTISKVVYCYKTDVGVVGVKSPTSGNNLSQEAVTIIVKNFGEVNITDNFGVRYTLDGGTPKNGTIRTAINAKDSVEFTFTDSVNLSTAKSYTLKAYTVLTTDDDRSNDTMTVTITNFGVGINQVNEAVTLKLYPNPTTNILNIYSDYTINTLIVRNIAGQVIERKMNVGQKNLLLQVSGFAKGIYMVEIETEKGMATRKLIVQ